MFVFDCLLNKEGGDYCQIISHMTNRRCITMAQGTVIEIVWREAGDQQLWPLGSLGSQPIKKKRGLCIFWAMQGQVHWEVLPKGVYVTSDIYCQQINQVDLVISVCKSHNLFNRPVIFQADTFIALRKLLILSRTLSTVRQFFTRHTLLTTLHKIFIYFAHSNVSS